VFPHWLDTAGVDSLIREAIANEDARVIQKDILYPSWVYVIPQEIHESIQIYSGSGPKTVTEAPDLLYAFQSPVPASYSRDGITLLVNCSLRIDRVVPTTLSGGVSKYIPPVPHIIGELCYYRQPSSERWYRYPLVDGIPAGDNSPIEIAYWPLGDNEITWNGQTYRRVRLWTNIDQFGLMFGIIRPDSATQYDLLMAIRHRYPESHLIGIASHLGLARTLLVNGLQGASTTFGVVFHPVRRELRRVGTNVSIPPIGWAGTDVVFCAELGIHNLYTDPDIEVLMYDSPDKVLAPSVWRTEPILVRCGTKITATATVT